MSKHSKNANSQVVFSHKERHKLKNQYGDVSTRIGKDSLKKFECCSICNCKAIEPNICDQGHLFCRACIIQYLMREKKKQQQAQNQILKYRQATKNEEKEKQFSKEVEELQKFQKYDSYLDVSNRNQFVNKKSSQLAKNQQVQITDVKPTGIYDIKNDKNKYIKNSFWCIENTPDVKVKPENLGKVIMCPAHKHKITFKKLRPLKCKQIQDLYCCWICNKEIISQRIGCYQCGEVVCLSCKSDRCQLCEENKNWKEIENVYSGFASKGKVEVKTYTHAFVV